ncbi:MAG: hypothetical protein Q8K75_10585 [Chlamydiales bacterium]|nr:hypothetical protein [Chlamydiales bacterium]
MLVTPGRKNKVVLADYSYRRDIENRLMLAQLSVFDVDVLSEVLNSSLTFPISDIVETLEAPLTKIVESLDKLVTAKLLQHDGRTVRVDKELRKYYEYQIEKFEEDFAPDLEYILRGLKRIPIQVLPNWYSIPKTTDDIFVSIIEKHLQTPKVYRRHLLDISFDDPIPLAIMEEVYSAEDFKVRSKTLRDKYALTREQFEEYMLLLEFNFVCYLTYTKVDDMWKEVVTPMHEWREFLRFRRDTVPTSIPEGEVDRFHRNADFAFVQDLVALVRILEQQPLPVEVNGTGLSLPPKALTSWLPALPAGDANSYASSLVNRALHLGLAEVKDKRLSFAVAAKEWLRKQPQDQAMAVYRAPIRLEDYPTIKPNMFTEKNLRETEKSLKRVANMGWVNFDDFLRGMSEPLGDGEAISLRQKGRRWSYAIPAYSADDKIFIKELIFKRLFEVGMVTIGQHNGKPCFAVTAFGRIALGD